MNRPEIEFVPFLKMARLRRSVVITEKIDGTNALVHISDDGQVYAGSRTRWITLWRVVGPRYPTPIRSDGEAFLAVQHGTLECGDTATGMLSCGPSDHLRNF